MSRFYEIGTSISYMTKFNAIRHAIAKGKKAKTYEQQVKVYNKYDKYWAPEEGTTMDQCCKLCKYRDHRALGADCCMMYDETNLNSEEIFVKFCFPRFLEYLEKELTKSI